jgi:hypothetical protein
MALSRVKYSGNAVTTNFAVPFPYLDKTHVQVYVDAVIKVDPTNYSFPDATHILFVTAPPATAANNVEFRRYSGAAALVDFSDGAAVVEANLDLMFLQSLFVAQEAFDQTTSNGAVLLSIADLTDVTAIGEQIAQAANAAAVRTLLDVPLTAHNHAGTDITSGTVPTARLGSGTANAATYLTGAQTYAPLSDIPKADFLLTPAGAFFPSANFPQLVKNVGANRVDYTLDFDTTTGESAEWEVLIPTGKVFTAASVEISSRQAANTTGTVGWVVGAITTADNEAWDTAVVNTTVSNTTVKGTAGKVHKQTAAIVTTGWAAGEVLTIRVTRDVANDNTNEDVKFMNAVVRLT